MEKFQCEIAGIMSEVSYINGVGLRIQLAEFSQPLILTDLQILNGVSAMSDAFTQVQDKLRKENE